MEGGGRGRLRRGWVPKRPAAEVANESRETLADSGSTESERKSASAESSAEGGMTPAGPEVARASADTRVTRPRSERVAVAG